MTIQLWLGLECTVNRVGQTYFDQVQRTGHEFRIADLYQLFSIGASAMRYPLLWERTAPEGVPDWRWPDERLELLRTLGISPVAGLLHHGSGPRYTNLLDRYFPEKFAAYARACAERYPWVEDYIPVNEPLTTARFSALYGHWYPHRADDLSFLRALLNECKASVLAMREIRAVNSCARFLQNDDLGKTLSTRKLRYQADFENERRWLTFDLLCGRVDRHHPMWSYCLWAGITERDLLWFEENACTPDIIGINHYLTSDRYLDHRVDLFPESTHGGNGRDRYADVEAVRACPAVELGLDKRIRESWQRYRIPIVITEAHLACPDADESSRWLWEVWNAAHSERLAGADVRAVTAWSVLGAYDWDSLVTRRSDSYEPGLFDARFSPPRPTALATLARELASGTVPSSSALRDPGWWRRDERLLYSSETSCDSTPPSVRAKRPFETHRTQSQETWL